MHLADILDVSVDYQCTTGNVPRLIGLHPDDFDYLVLEVACAHHLRADGVITICGMRCVPCPDTDVGKVEVLAS